VTPAGNIIGVDESGKGDFFGPLVVAGLLAGKSDLAYFHEIGVRDSKRISDNRISAIDEQLRARFPHGVVVLMPEEYNRRYDQTRNLNVLLADCHAGVIVDVMHQGHERRVRVDLAISDKFGKTERLVSALSRIDCRLRVEQLVRGETVPQVAAASILARAEFVRRMHGLSKEFGLELPKGASAQVDEVGRQLVARYGETVLARASKKHFKNYRRSLITDLFR
jgi:ribonuclease HIII